MYERILVPTDGSTEAEKGVDHAVDLAASVGATLHVLYVVEEGINPWMRDSVEDQDARAREYGQEIIDAVAAKAADAGVDVVTEIEVGPDVHEKINEYTREEDIDLVVMGSGYRGKFGGLLGSTAEKVLRSAKVPVTTIRQSDWE